MSDWAARVYEQDKVSAAVCRRMSQAGFAFDRQRANDFAAQLRILEADALRRADEGLGRTIQRTKTGGLSTTDLQKAFFQDLRAPVYKRSDLTGLPSLGVDAMRGYAACRSPQLRALSLALLDYRRARKIRSTYIEAIQVGNDGRVHCSWLNYGTVSGRWSSQDPNLANLPRAVNDPTTPWGGIRSLYHAAPGCVLVGFDKSQIEFRIAAYASGDEAMIAVCEGGDVHGGNAKALFGDAFDPAEYKRLKAADEAHTATEAESARFVQLDGLRTVAKSAVFAVCYLAEAKTVHDRIIASGLSNIKLSMVETMLSSMKRRFATYYAFQDKRLMSAVRLGYTESPILGRRRWVGHEPSPPEVANFLCQAGAADVMNREIALVEAAVLAHEPKARLVAHVYDSVYVECPESSAEAVTAICKEIAHEPICIASSGVAYKPVLKIDCKTKERWS